MALFGRTQNTAPAPATTAPARSKYGGIKGGDGRDPMLQPGTYRVQIAECVEGFNPGKRRESYKVTLRVLAADEAAGSHVGSLCTMICFHTSAGLSELKRFAVAAAGFGPTLQQRASAPDVKKLVADGEANYDALDEETGHYSGAILEASSGRMNGAPPLVGRIVDVIVANGKPVPNPQTGEPTGDFFRVYTWGAVPDAEQAGA